MAERINKLHGMQIEDNRVPDLIKKIEELEVKLAGLPTLPETAGSYALTVTEEGEKLVYSWEVSAAGGDLDLGAEY
ncbi:MAG: hypothetical protein M0Q88_00620 [Bacilli bacterium]|nr:hypothetical protein [Bacilli bacterium]